MRNCSMVATFAGVRISVTRNVCVYVCYVNDSRCLTASVVGIPPTIMLIQAETYVDENRWPYLLYGLDWMCYGLQSIRLYATMHAIPNTAMPLRTGAPGYSEPDPLCTRDPWTRGDYLVIRNYARLITPDSNYILIILFNVCVFDEWKGFRKGLIKNVPYAIPSFFPSFSNQGNRESDLIGFC